MKRLFSFFFIVMFACTTAVLAETPPINLGHFNKLAMNGYDVMTYWRGGKPEEGNPAISFEYKGATWVFTSEEHRALFSGSPEKYAPQYGGYCAYAASRNAIADVDPYAWRIWKEKLYLNYSERVRRQWASDIDENIEQANGFWRQLVNQ